MRPVVVFLKTNSNYVFDAMLLCWDGKEKSVNFAYLFGYLFIHVFHTIEDIWQSNIVAV